jgi:hypothetical protein
MFQVLADVINRVPEPEKAFAFGLRATDFVADFINFWVAAGTLAMARTTWMSLVKTDESMAQTKNVLAAEERRHQQSFAPIIELTTNNDTDADFIKFNIQNIGKGVALNIAIEGDIRIDYIKYHYPQLADNFIPQVEEHIEHLRKKSYHASEYRVPGIGLVTKKHDGYYLQTVLEKKPDYMKTTINMPSLREDAKKMEVASCRRDLERERHEANADIYAYYRIKIFYHDIFGNKYQTVYDGTDLRRYVWKTPDHLKFDNAS